MTSAYPIADEVLVEKVRALAAELGETPSKRSVMRACSVGAPRASAALDTLRADRFDPTPRPPLTAVPDAPADEPQEHLDDKAPGESEAAPDVAVEGLSSRPEVAPKPLVEAPQVQVTPEYRDWVADLGVLLVGLAAAVITFSTMRDLAITVGLGGSVFGFDRAWLLPITVDVAGVVGARVWLRGRAPDAAIRFARALTFAAIAASVAFNAGEHVMAALALAAPWPVVVAVTAVPPLTLAAVVHLGHLTRKGK